MREPVEEPPYCAQMVSISMSCSCWTDIEAIKVKFLCYEVPSPPFPLSTLAFSPFKVKLDGCSRPRLDSPESCNSNLFIRVAILTSLSLSAFVRRMTLYSISTIFSSMVEVSVIIIGMTFRYDGENDESKVLHSLSFSSWVKSW